MRTLRALLTLSLLLLTGPRFVPQPQSGPQFLERIPTPINRTDTFPRWQNPTRPFQFVNDTDFNWPPSSNPQTILHSSGTQLNYINYTLISMDVDSRGVLHCAGQITRARQLPGGMPGEVILEAQVLYANNSKATRGASGFGGIEILADYTNVPYADGLREGWWAEAVGAQVAIDSNDNVHIVWRANLSMATPYQTTRIISTKSDLFHRVKTSSGWSQTTQLTNLPIGVEFTQSYTELKLEADGTGSVHVAGSIYTEDQNWVIDPAYMDGGYWVWAPDSPSSDIVYSGAVPALFPMAEVIDGSTGALHDFKYNAASNYLMVVYRGELVPDGPTHIVSRIRGPGTWGPPFDICGLGGPGLDVYGEEWGSRASVGFGPDGFAHYAYLIGRMLPGTLTSVTEVFHRVDSAPPTQASVLGLPAYNPQIVCDSRSQPHIVYEAPVEWENGTEFAFFYANQVRNPQTGLLDGIWRRQDIIAAPIYEQDLDNDLFVMDYMYAARNVLLIGPNDQLHCLDWVRQVYTCTQEYCLGVRDGIALQPVMPNAQANLSNGNVLIGIPLFNTTGVSPNQSLEVVYNTLDNDYGSISRGWRLSCEARLIDHGLALNNPHGPYTDQTNEVITVIMPDGRAIVLRYRTYQEGPALGYFVAYDEYGVFAKVERTSWTQLNQPYVMTFKNGNTWTFDGQGRLSEMRDRAGRYIALNYEDGLLTSVVDQLPTASRATNIDYESVSDQRRPRRISSITDPTGAEYEFLYSGDFLTGLRLPATSSTGQTIEYAFTYHSTNNQSAGYKRGLLNEFMTPKGRLGSYGWSCEYHPDGRIRKITDPEEVFLLDSEGETATPVSRSACLTFEYAEPSPMTPEPMGGTIRETLMSDRRGVPTIYCHEGRRGLVREIKDWTVINMSAQPRSTPGYTSVLRTFNNLGNLLTSRDRNGSVTSIDYESPDTQAPHVLDDISTVSRDSVQLASYTYTSGPFRTLHTASTYVNGAARVTTVSFYSTAPIGRLQSIVFPNVTRPDGVPQEDASIVLQYDAYGGLQGVVDEEGATTSFGVHSSIHRQPTRITLPGNSQYTELDYSALGQVFKQKAPVGTEGNGTPEFTEAVLDSMQRVGLMKTGNNVFENRKYDADSQLIEVLRRETSNSTMELTYDKRGFVSGGTVQKDGGGTLQWSQWVDANGNIRRMQNIRGHFTHHTYDPLNRIESTRTEGGSSLSGELGGGGPQWHVTEYVHDGYEDSQHISTVNRKTTGSGQDRITKTHFDLWHRPIQILEPDEQTKTVNTFDSQGHLVSSTKYHGSTFLTCRVLLRDARDRVYLERVQSAAYDPQGEAPSPRQDTFTLYNKAGHVIQVVDPRGSVTNTETLAYKTTYQRDAQGRVVRIAHGAGPQGAGVVVVKNVYGDDGLLSEVQVPDPTQSEPQYTSVTSHFDIPAGINIMEPPLVVWRKYRYTALKELHTVKNANDKGETYTYVPHSQGGMPGQIETITNAANVVRKMTYYPGSYGSESTIDAYGTSGARTVKTIRDSTDPGKVTTRVFINENGSQYADYVAFSDRAGRIERYEAPQVLPWRYFYNSWGENSRQVAGGRDVSHFFNRLGQNYESVWTGLFSEVVNREFDDSGNLTLIEDSVGGKSRQYSMWRGTLTSETANIAQTPWKTVSYTNYDSAGNLSSLQDAESKYHGWVRDDAGRISELKYDAKKVASIQYTPGGQVWKYTLFNASEAPIAVTEYTYDLLGRKKRAVTKHNDTVRSDVEWGYNDLDQIESIVHHHLSLTIALEYNALGELKKESTTGNGSGDGGLVVPSRIAEYEYDRRGNRTKKTVTTASGAVVTDYEYDSGSRLNVETTGSTTVDYDYDDWGNLFERVTTTGSSEECEWWAYNYNNIADAYLTDESSWWYLQYPSGGRFAKVNIGATPDQSQLFLQLGSDVLSEYTQSGTGQIAHQQSYVQSLGIDTKSTRIPVSGGRLHYIGDLVGTVAMTLTDGGSVQEQVVRDSWGNAFAGHTNSERYGFAQRERDSESSLVYMRHRMYDPRIGRFTQVDPVLGNRPHEHYSYVRNNPVSRTDPWGLCWICRKEGPCDCCPICVKKVCECQNGETFTVDLNPGRNNVEIQQFRNWVTDCRRWEHLCAIMLYVADCYEQDMPKTHDSFAMPTFRLRKANAIRRLRALDPQAFYDLRDYGNRHANQAFGMGMMLTGLTGFVPGPQAPTPPPFVFSGNPRLAPNFSPPVFELYGTLGAAQPPRYLPRFGWTGTRNWNVGVRSLMEGKSVTVRNMEAAEALRDAAFPGLTRSNYRGPLSKAPNLKDTWDVHDPAVVPHEEHNMLHIQIWTKEGPAVRIFVNPKAESPLIVTP